eukprot:g8830.t1
MKYSEGGVALDEGTLWAMNSYFRSLPITMLTLFMSIAGGVDWEDPLLAVSAVSPWWTLLFLFYIATCHFQNGVSVPVMDLQNSVVGFFCDAIAV